MPKCCVQTQVQFVNATSTTIAYTQDMRDMYGIQPKVYVYYYDPVTGEFYLAPWFTFMGFDGDTITIDHGGPNTGVVVVT